tara:strand:+ start:4214 stop:4444 length:231 start_codon:yes stop_codon:yes gene_type:complete
MNLFKRIPAEVARTFNRAVTNEENLNEDGSINWNFVQADFYIDTYLPDSEKDLAFDLLVDTYQMAPWERRTIEVVV